MSRLARFLRAPHTREQGRLAESEAVRWLTGRGYRILERNYRTKTGEIDLIAIDADTLCFIEIKARAGSGYGSALAAVDARKQKKIAAAAALYLARNDWQGPCRFDVLGLDRSDGKGWNFRLIRDAFSL